MLLVKKQFLCESCNETQSYLVLCVFLRAVPSPKRGWPRSPQVEGETSGQERVRGQGRRDASVTQPELHSWLFVTRL